jgi:outer membrane protein TolC
VLSERINRYGQTILIAFREVEDALIQERKQRELIVSFARQLELSRLALERTRSAYLQGQSDYIRVLSAISTLQSLERNDLAARRELVERRIDLCRALGGGWEMRSPPLAPLLTRK